MPYDDWKLQPPDIDPADEVCQRCDFWDPKTNRWVATPECDDQCECRCHKLDDARFSSMMGDESPLDW